MATLYQKIQNGTKLIKFVGLITCFFFAVLRRFRAMGARRGGIRLSVRLKISMRWVPPQAQIPISVIAWLISFSCAFSSNPKFWFVTSDFLSFLRTVLLNSQREAACLLTCQMAALRILVQMLLSTNTTTRVVSSSNSWFVDRLC